MTSSLKWHGGKHYLASRIIGLFPPHTHYVEPYAGGLSVLLAHPRRGEGVSEVVNDIDSDLTNFWAVLQYGRLFAEFHRRIQCVPFSQMEWSDARSFLDRNEQASFSGTEKRPDINRAIAFFISCRQSLAGRMEAFAPLSRTRVRRGMNEQAAAWLTTVEGMVEVHARLKRVVILNDQAVKVIQSQDGPDTLFYLDPPYLPDSRTAPDVYRHEMTKLQHIDLLAAISCIRGKFVLSGYPSELYDGYARAEGWTRREFELPNNSAGGKAKKRMVEVVWMNYKPKEDGK